MALKPRYKRRIFWAVVSVMGLIAMAVVFIPPMINLNYLKPKITAAVLAQTGINAKIDGDVHFSLLGGVLIVAHDINVPMGNINSAMFSVPLKTIFDTSATELPKQITIYGANLTVENLAPQMYDTDIELHDSIVRFMNKNYEIIQGTLFDGKFNGLIRLDDHRYEIDFENDMYRIRNGNNKLNIEGQLYSDGSTRGQMELETDNINGLFGFSKPKINETVAMTANFEWDGGRGLKFHDIHANSFDGDIDLYPNGNKNIRLTSDDMNFDFSFLLKPNRILYRTNFDLDFHGNLKFAGQNFEHLRLKAIATNKTFQITNLIADDIIVTGGVIDENGAHNLMISMPYVDTTATCLFSGTTSNWKCSEFSYKDMTGSMSVSNDNFEIFVQSNGPMPTNFNREHFAKFGRTGRVNFQFSDIGGAMEITANATTPSYTFARGKTLDWIGIKIPFLPKFMTDAVGNFTWNGSTMNFIPNDGEWMLRIDGDEFAIAGTNSKEWLPNLDLRSVNKMPYTISGAYKDGNISNLKIGIAGQEFSGTASRGAITLHTPLLNLDAFINQEYLDNYSEMEFLSMSPIMIPFGIDLNVSISADKLIYNGNEFSNFIYLLKPNQQTFSITDSARGNLLAIISRNKNKYEISAQVSKFKTYGTLLNSNMPLNIRDTMVTGEIDMTTSGQIAHDITYNLAGTMDLSFDGGYLIGLGFDDFYASAENITTLNAEYALADAFAGGETQIKKMRIIGEYQNGNFETTQPLELQVRHVDAIGTLTITDGFMQADLRMLMRGTSPVPAPVSLAISPDNTRKYSLSQIMTDFDPGFMRSFVKTHNKF